MRIIDPAIRSLARRILNFSLVLLFVTNWAHVHAAQVPEGTARSLAASYLSHRGTSLSALRGEDLQLVLVKSGVAEANTDEVVYYRVYNSGSNAFVIVSGDDVVVPVLGYSTVSGFPTVELPANIAKWLQGYEDQIRGAILAQAPVPVSLEQEWQRAKAGLTHGMRDIQSVSPLVQTQWDQQPNVNAMCPGGSVTGCVATAMAQVMKYHNHPAQGVGFHSYNAPNYGTLSANFAATTYNWSGMPNTVTGANSAVATLMYHCGVAVDMQYSPQVSNAYVLSDASPIQNCAEYALKNYFGYATSMQGVQRDSYSESSWITLLKGELNASRPIIYAGFGSGGGHCFVCDGYDDSNFFHFNWGWGGQVNGYFTVGALNPGSTGTGGGTGGYNSGQQALIGIQPSTGGGGGAQPSNLGLYTYVSPTAYTLYYGQPFSVSTNIVNNASTAFSGDYAAAVFDASSNFYGFVEELDGYSLPAGYVYNNNLVFSTPGLFSMVPGSYYIGIMSRATGASEWVLVANNGGYTNLVPVNVINPNAIEIAHAITVTPGNQLTQGGQVSVNLNVVNTGNYTFQGQYGVALYNLDGSWAQDVGTLNEDNGLPSGYSYLAPYLTFGPTAVTVTPGTYLIAAQHNPNGTGWQLTGSTNFANPVFVTVTAPAVPGDQYEVNNTAAQAYSLPVNFSVNSAHSPTTGSNLHNGTDQDFYKVVLPSGTNYAITARLHDSYNSGNGNNYSVDGIWSWSSDGNNWSGTYDDVMPGTIVVTGGGTLWFHVAPYFAGETGTYLLQLDIEKGANVAVTEIPMLEGISFRPNPASDRLVVDLGAFTGTPLRIELFGTDGRTVLDRLLDSNDLPAITLDVSTFPPGAYVAKLQTDQGVRTAKIIITR
ncbi:MAG: C10 family peptidase [Flavobacteriales bacterium]